MGAPFFLAYKVSKYLLAILGHWVTFSYKVFPDNS